MSYVLVAVVAGGVGSSVALLATQGLGESGRTNAATTDSIEPAVTGDDVLASTTKGDSETAEALRTLQLQVENAEQQRRQMSESAVQLSRELFDLQEQVEILQEANENRTADEIAAALSEPVSTFNEAARRPRDRFNRNNGADRLESLLAAGIDEQRARDIQSRSDKHQLARLELIDQAAREGWSDSSQLSDKLRELNKDRVNLREELGDTDYDQFLYESGSTNRVNIASIISGSAADLAGLNIGDMILSYDSQRIFRVRQLQEATRAGSRGEYVQVVFERNGSQLTSDIPRGPLGVTLSTTTVEP